MELDSEKFNSMTPEVAELYNEKLILALSSCDDKDILDLCPYRVNKFSLEAAKVYKEMLNLALDSNILKLKASWTENRQTEVI